MSEIPPPPATPATRTNETKWFKKKFLKLPLWIWIIGVLLIIGSATQSGTKTAEKSASGSPIETIASTTAAPKTTSSAPPVTTAESTTTTAKVEVGATTYVELLSAASEINVKATTINLG